MPSIEASFQVVTPLFMRGAREEAEIRPPSVKGALRFWYRAVVLARHKTWQQVREAEKEVFGSTDGQSSFLLRLEGEHGRAIAAGGQWPASNAMTPPIGSSYLGYGLCTQGRHQRTTRCYFAPDFRFKCQLIFRPKVRNCEQAIADMKLALQALGLFGGLGSRARRGFGSVCLESLKEDDREIWVLPRDKNELKQRMEVFLGELGALPDELPEYSAFSRSSRVVIAGLARDAHSILEEVGREMIRYRSWGSSKPGVANQLTWGEKAEQNFREDHQVARDTARGRIPATHPHRVVFGLPHNYYFSSDRANVQVNGESGRCERRASPLLIHIHRLGAEYATVLTLLPASYLPEGAMVMMKSGHHRVEVPCRADYQVIHSFLDRFPDRLEVRIP